MVEAAKDTTVPLIPQIKLEGLLSDHSSADQVVEIKVEPSIVYAEVAGIDSHLNFDFVLTRPRGLADRVDGRPPITFLRIPSVSFLEISPSKLRERKNQALPSLDEVVWTDDIMWSQ